MIRMIVTETGKFELFRDGDQYVLRYIPGQVDDIGNFVPSGDAREVVLRQPEDDPIIASADDIAAYMKKFS